MCFGRNVFLGLHVCGFCLLCRACLRLLSFCASVCTSTRVFVWVGVCDFGVYMWVCGGEGCGVVVGGVRCVCVSVLHGFKMGCRAKIKADPFDLVSEQEREGRKYNFSFMPEFFSTF